MATKETFVETNAENLEIIERMETVSNDMRFLAGLMLKNKSAIRDKLRFHGTALMGAAAMMKDWQKGIGEDEK